MVAISSTNSLPDVKTTSKAWILVVAGYSTAAVALVAFLTINGASGIPMVVTIGTAGSVAIGLTLPAVGMLRLRRDLGQIEHGARYGLAMQAFGLLGLLLAVVLVVVFPSLSGYLVSALFVVTAGAIAIIGAVLTRRAYTSGIGSNTRSVAYLIFGTAMIFSGAGLIVGSNVALEYLISQAENTIYVDIGATVSACGCVIAAYSFFGLHGRS